MDIQRFKGKYFGLNQIKEIALSKEKTYLGSDKVELVYDEENKETLPLEVVEKAATDRSIDLSVLRDKKVMPVIEKLLVVLLESELTNPEIGYATGSKLIFTLEECKDRADKILWGKERQDLTLMDVEKVLKSKTKSVGKSRNKKPKQNGDHRTASSRNMAS